VLNVRAQIGFSPPDRVLLSQRRPEASRTAGEVISMPDNSTGRCAAGELADQSEVEQQG